MAELGPSGLTEWAQKQAHLSSRGKNIVFAYAAAWEADKVRIAEFSEDWKSNFEQYEQQLVEAKERIRELEQWAERAEETLVYAATILGPWADSEGGPAKIAMTECEDRFVEYAGLRDASAPAPEEGG